MNGDDIKAMKQAINEIAAQNDGTITPEQVVHAAVEPTSPLHKYFEWDDSVAAALHRKDQARMLIRKVKVSVTYETRTVRSVAYVRDPSREPDDAGYISVARVRKDEDRARDVLLEEFKRAGAALERARSLAKMFDLEESMDAFIKQLDMMRSHVIDRHPEH